MTQNSDRIAFIRAAWHADIIDHAHAAFLAEMEKLGTPRDMVDTIEVTGAFEIPLQAKLMARSGRYAAIVASALVVDGGIYRHEYVADTVIKALMTVQLETEVPVLSAVLTPLHFHEHAEHQGFFARHFVTKGQEAARACIGTLRNLTQARVLAA